MPFKLYRRHAPPAAKQPCKVHSLPLSGKEKIEYTKCECQIWYRGMDESSKVYRREPLHTTDWDVAVAKLKALDADSKIVEVHGEQIKTCIATFLEQMKDELDPGRYNSYVLLLDRFEEYCTGKDTFFIQQVDADLLKGFISHLKATYYKKRTSLANTVSSLKSFLRIAFENDWITVPLALKIKTIKAIKAPGAPFTDSEVEAMLTGALQMNHPSLYGSDGLRLNLLMRFMKETGNRVSDTIRYNPATCVQQMGENGKPNPYFTYTFVQRKRKRHAELVYVTSTLTPQLKLAIDQCNWMSETLPFSDQPLDDADGNKIHNNEHNVSKAMVILGKACDVKKCRPHRLRDTFAVGLLLEGWLLQDVSRLLHHKSIKVTELHYADWVKPRVDRLAEALYNRQISKEA